MQNELFASAPLTDPTSHNLFFGLLPDEGTRACLAQQAERLRLHHAPHGRWLKPHRYHLTLHFLGSFRPLHIELVQDARQAATNIRLQAFDLVLDRAGAFARNGVGWLGCTQPHEHLQALWEGLRQALARARVKIDGLPEFTPHVTVLRDATGPLPSQSIEPIVWPVREFVLIDSQIGSRNLYVPLGRWSLVQ